MRQSGVVCCRGLMPPQVLADKLNEWRMEAEAEMLAVKAKRRKLHRAIWGYYSSI